LTAGLISSDALAKIDDSMDPASSRRDRRDSDDVTLKDRKKFNRQKTYKREQRRIISMTSKMIGPREMTSTNANILGRTRMLVIQDRSREEL